MTNLIKDIESFFSNVESSIAGKLSGASADVVKKTVALAHVAEQLASTFASDAETTWSSLDNQSLASIASSVAGLVHAGDYEKAAFGLMYLIYQGGVEATNKAEAEIAKVLSSATSSSASTPAAATSAPATSETIVQKVEGEAQKIWTDMKDGATYVAHKIEDVFEGSPAPAAAPVASAATPAVAPAAPVQAEAAPATPAPAVAAANPPAAAAPAEAPVAAKPVLAS